MGNLGGMELLVIFLLALVVLGPAKLPDAARQVGKAVTELRRISGGFQKELREAIQEPVAEAKSMLKGDLPTTSAPSEGDTVTDPPSSVPPTTGTGSDDPPTSPTLDT